MTWNMKEQEFQSVLSLPPAQRYEYFIKKITDWEEVWSLADNEGWALAGDNQGHEVIPVWPHAKFAKICASGSWANFEPRVISLAEWIEKWLPGIKQDNRLVAVFPLPTDKGIVVGSERITSDLESELSLYE